MIAEKLSNDHYQFLFIVKSTQIKGFTLAEILVVVVIIAIVSAFAAPYYVKAVEKGRQAEAVILLGELRQAHLRYYYETGNFTGNISDLDWSDIQGKYFTNFVPIGNLSAIVAICERRSDIAQKWTPKEDYQMWIYYNGEIDKDPLAP